MKSLDFISKQLNQEVTLDTIVYYTTVFSCQSCYMKIISTISPKSKDKWNKRSSKRSKIILPNNIQNTHWASGVIDSEI